MKLEEHIEDIGEQFYKQTEELARVLVDEIKKTSKDYGDAKKKLEIFRASIMFSNPISSRYSELYCAAHKILMKEINGLKISDRLKD